MSLQSLVEQPATGRSYYRQRIPVEGWIYADYRHERIKRISAHAPVGEIGSTTHFFKRSAVNTSLKISAEIRTGFRFVATFEQYPLHAARVGIEVRVEFTDGSVVALAGIHVALFEDDFTSHTFGELCNPQHQNLQRRDHVHAEICADEKAHQECVELLSQYLAPGSGSHAAPTKPAPAR